MEERANMTFKDLAKEAKRRMKSGYWVDFDKKLQDKLVEVRSEGGNPSLAAEYYVNATIKEVNGKKKTDDEFYLKVKRLLTECGEVSDAIGRLIDRELFEQMNYEQRQRYTLDLSNKYVEALERFRKEREYGALAEK